MERSADAPEPEPSNRKRSGAQGHPWPNTDLMANAVLGPVNAINERIANAVPGHAIAIAGIAGLIEELAIQVSDASTSATCAELVNLPVPASDRFSDVLAGPITLDQAVRLVTYVHPPARS